MASKRARSTNFTKEENVLLTSLVERHRNVIECKTSDASTWKTKEEAWKRIEVAFNAQCGMGGYRCAKTLKNKYELLKRLTRKKSAAIRQELYKTGGGPNNAPVLDSVEEKIKSMILLSCDGHESTFDSDQLPGTGVTQYFYDDIFEINGKLDDPPAITAPEAEMRPPKDTAEVDIHLGPVITTEEEPAIGMVLEIPDPLTQPTTSYPEEEKLEGDVTPVRKWDASSRRFLKTKMNSALKNSSKTTIERGLDARLELIALQKELVAEERELVQKKLEWEHEEHIKRLEILDLEIKIKQKQLNELSN